MLSENARLLYAEFFSAVKGFARVARKKSDSVLQLADKINLE